MKNIRIFGISVVLIVGVVLASALGSQDKPASTGSVAKSGTVG